MQPGTVTCARSAPPRRETALGKALWWAVRWSGYAPLVRNTVARRRVGILLYHDPEPDVLDRHLAYLGARYTFITLDQLVDAIRQRRWSLPAKSLVLTLDDGHRGNIQLLDVFRRHGVSPTIYLCSQIVGTHRHFWFLEIENPEPLKSLDADRRLALLRQASGFEETREHQERQALNHEEIEQLKEHVDFGSHTRFHPVLTTCPDADCWAEIQLAKEEIEGLVGSDCRHFSFPNGDYSARELALVQRAGYASARTLDIGWNSVATNPYRLKILGTNDDASLNRLAADLAGVGSYLARVRIGSFRGRHRQVAQRVRRVPR